MRVNWGTKRRTWADAVYTKPTEDGQGEEAYTFKIYVEALPDPDMRALATSGNEEAKRIIAAHVLDWSGPRDEKGDPVPFDTDELLEGMDQDQDVRDAVLRALAWASREGVRKNSRTSPG